MKNIIIFSIIFLSISLNSCIDICKGVDCGANGEVTSQIKQATSTVTPCTCTCYNGYEHDSYGKCNQEVRAKFIGTYGVVEYCPTPGLNSNYDVTISQSSMDILQVSISNFAYVECQPGVPFIVRAQIIPPNIIRIIDYDNCNGQLSLSAQDGLWDNNKITMSYSLLTQGQTYNCSFTMTKK